MTKYLPSFVALALGFLWSLLYALLGVLSGMWAMAGEQFPFLFSLILGIDTGTMSPTLGILAAFFDGAFVGFLAGWLFRKFTFYEEPRHE